MRKTLAIACIALGTIFVAASPVLAAKDDPHQEETDGCDHGHTGKDCKPDPQPDHGKDCDEHGNHGGVNEDHCAPTTTTTQPPTTTKTKPPTTTPPRVPETPTTTTEPPTVTIPTVELPQGTKCTDVNGFPYTTSYPTC